MTNTRRVERYIFVGIVALVFVASAVATICWNASMAAMPDDAMVWQPMCGQGWIGAAASFIGMWAVMMVAMMLPSLSPMLWRQLHSSSGGMGSVAITAAGYFLVWIALGVAIFPMGAAWAVVQIQLSQAGTGLVVAIAGALQFTAWKARHLACCRGMSIPASATAGHAFRQGVRMGIHCCCTCAGFTLFLLAVGLMDLRVMAVITMALTLERCLPDGVLAARGIGTIAVGVGAFLILQN